VLQRQSTDERQALRGFRRISSVPESMKLMRCRRLHGLLTHNSSVRLPGSRVAFARAGFQAAPVEDGQGRAATSGYVEDNRRETAIRFIVDALNGKVDSMLSRTKADDVGTLRQQIIDASAMVNFNGAAFRDTHITEDSLHARLEELKWAASTTDDQRLKYETQLADLSTRLVDAEARGQRTTWTLAAAAADYRETTRAIEERIRSDAGAREQ
jgi:hypothetical protein